MNKPLNLSQNQRRILDLIRLEGPVSRAELTQMSGLTPGAITRLTKELIGHGLVYEGDRRTGLRGQPALPLQINGRGGVAIGVAMPYGRIDMVALDYQGNALLKSSIAFEGKSISELDAALDILFTDFCPQFFALGLRLVGVGLALSGYTKSGSWQDIVLPETLRWIDIRYLSSRLHQVFKTVVLVENTANAAALGEFCEANDPALNDLVAINLGHGVGSGLVVSKKIHRGMKGYAGEVGSLYPTTEPRPSSHDLMTSLRAAGRPLSSIDELSSLDPDQDLLLSAWIRRSSTQLLSMIFMIKLLLAPQKVVLTGMLPRAITEQIVSRISIDLERYQDKGWFPWASLCSPSLETWSSAFGAAWLPIRSEGQFT